MHIGNRQVTHRSTRMNHKHVSAFAREGLFTMPRLVLVAMLLFVLVPTRAGAVPGLAQIETQAGQWHTWVLTSGSQFRPVPPPDATASQVELDQLRALADQRDDASLDQIAFWD